MIESLKLTPFEFQQQSTSDFAAQHLKPKAAILDVGAGSGQIAKNLYQKGFQVTALDRKLGNEVKGLKFIEGDFLETSELKEEKFDALLFSRVMHHLVPLRQTSARARSLLKEKGKIIIEDFSYERVDERTCAWLFPLAALLYDRYQINDRHAWLCSSRGGLSLFDADSPEDYVRQALEVWRRHHEEKHHIAPFEHIKSVLDDDYVVEMEARVPYLFRYLCDLLPDTTDGGIEAAKLAHWEAALAESGAIAPVGVRIVATLKS
ncbi:MAG: class I SAM-dependent methyltransferase [Candidatus Obscuribacterales bacterium]|nr:class I SAM-dependent methyltransferase [Candidatus Obscuribacterales bacterium]